MTLHARTAQRHLAAAGLHAGEPVSVEVDRIGALTQGALAEMRALIFELRPGALAEEGLVAALRKQGTAIGARTGLTITVHGPAERPVIDPAAEEHLYRVALEALNNAVKHAQATEVTDRDHQHGSGSRADRPPMTGSDSIPPRQYPVIWASTPCRDRAHAAGGTLQVASSAGRGTVVRVVVPALRHPAES